MSSKELERAQVLRQVRDGQLTQAQAARCLELTDRHVRRLLDRYERDGPAGLVSAKRGKLSNHCIAPATRDKVLDRFRQSYPDFGPTLACEYLRQEGLNLSRETLRQWLMHAGLWRPRRATNGRAHPPRPRRSRRGELVQIDGSPHDWFEGRGPRCTLIAFIDDATSEVMWARFCPVESTQAYLDGLREYTLQHGVPLALYSDRHGIFTKHDPEDGVPTQFQRALQVLNIEGIQALTPQAKGRVERLFQTLQDRLVKAMRLEGISSLEQARDWLPGYIKQHNTRFASAPADAQDGHELCVLSAEQLARTCAIHHERKLSKDLVVSFMRLRLIVQTGGNPRYALRGQKVTVVSYADGRIELLYGSEVLPYKVYGEAVNEYSAVDDKTLNQRVDEAAARRRGRVSIPAVDDLWHRGSTRTCAQHRGAVP